MAAGQANPFLTMTGEIEGMEEVPLDDPRRRAAAGEARASGQQQEEEPAQRRLWVWAKDAASQYWGSPVVQVRLHHSGSGWRAKACRLVLAVAAVGGF